MPPSDFVCPILQEVMDDPHVADDGYTYEYSTIKTWLGNKKYISNDKSVLER